MNWKNPARRLRRNSQLTPKGFLKEREHMSNSISAVTSSAGRAPYCAPRNDVEQVLAAIWSEILKLDMNIIGIHDSLKDLGGLQSLIIVQLVARIAVTFGVEIPISEILAQPTISQMATLIESARGEKTAPA
jgi:acyl carrier protein